MVKRTWFPNCGFDGVDVKISGDRVRIFVTCVAQRPMLAFVVVYLGYANPKWIRLSSGNLRIG
jgi:hypothetical protein